MSQELTKLSVSELREFLKNKKCSAEEATKSYLDRIREVEPLLNQYITVTEDLALEQARNADQKIKNGQMDIMTGIPIAIKDNLCTTNIKTTCASKMLANFVPTYESTITQNLWDRGAIMLGKTNMDEFAMGSANSHSYFGACINPLKRSKTDLHLVPGGSSGGSAAATASFSAAAAIGSDTGGSVRQPASFTGTVGLKPTYGRCSRWGMVAFASSLDQPGPITRDVRDNAIVLSAMASYDKKDSTSANQPSLDYEEFLSENVRSLKVGIPKEYIVDGMSSDISNMWNNTANLLKENGAEIVEVSLPSTHFASPTYYVIATAEASSNLARFDGIRYGHRTQKECANIAELYAHNRGEGFGAEVKRRIMMGTYVLSAGYYDAYYQKSLLTQKKIRKEFLEAFEKVDVILTPTAPNAAFALKEKNEDPLNMYLNDVFTTAINIAGLPAISLPAGLSKAGMPYGVQVIANHFREDKIFNVAYAIEKMVNFKQYKLNYHI